MPRKHGLHFHWDISKLGFTTAMAEKSNEVDKKISKQMSGLIELLTTSGKPQLNPEIMKKFKKICRTSDVYVQHAFDLLLMQLTKNHSEIRLSTFQMIDELFNRSHAFRVLVIENFQTILELTVGTDSSLPIPPPKAAAKTMKTETCRRVQLWYEKFRDGYTKLVLGYEFLKADKKANFEDVLNQIQQERQIEDENRRKIEQAKKDKLEKAEKEMNDGLPDIELVVTEVENGLELLMPHPDNFFIGSTLSPDTEGLNNTEQTSSSVESRQNENKTSSKLSNIANLNGLDSENREKTECNSENSVKPGVKSNNDIENANDKDTSNQGNEATNNALDLQKDAIEQTVDDYEDYSEDMRGGVFTKEHGLLSRTVEITVDVGAGDQRLKVTEDNADIVQDVKEKYKLIKAKYLNYVKRWIQVLTDCSGKKEDIQSLEALKSRLEEAIKKCLELDIISITTKSTDDSDSEDDFEDVPEKEGYEEDIPEHIKLEALSKATTSKGGRKKKSKVKEKKQYWMLSDEDDDINDPTTILLNLKHTPDKSKGSSKSVVKVKSEPGTSKVNKSVSSSSPSKSAKSASTSPTKSASTSPSKSASMSPTKSNRPSSTISTSSDAHTAKVKGKSKEDLLDKAPVKTFGVDLEHWENPDKIEAPLQVKYEGASRFWVPDKGDEGSTSQEQVAALTMRTMTFTGEFEPVKWKCRAPLPDGRLCERMDRKKCPFHGKIIPRDELGQPTDPEDIERIINEDLKQAGSSDESDSNSKGKSPVKGKGKAKKRKYPNLTDITVTKNCRQRLEAKIFNKSTLKRVNQCLDAADMKKVTDKFSNQFNYSLK